MNVTRRLWFTALSAGLIPLLACSSNSSPGGEGDASDDADAGEMADGGGSPDVVNPDAGSHDTGGQDVTTQDVTTQDTGSQDVAQDTTGQTDGQPSEGSTADAPADQAAVDANPCASPPTTDFYVDAANGNDANSGSGPGCALKTITAALTASAGAAFDNATIHLAAGTYSSGETFPLVVNHGRSLVGAGAGSTTIQGSSTAYNTTGTGSFLDTGTHYLSMLAGDFMGGATATDGGVAEGGSTDGGSSDGGSSDGGGATDYGKTTLNGFTLLPAPGDGGATSPITSAMGLACIRGNAPNTGSTTPIPDPNLSIQNVTVGPNFDFGVAIGYSPTQSSGCNAFVTGSTFTGDNLGLETGTCGSSNPVQSWPSSQIGTGVPADANTFSNCTLDMLGGGCGSVQSISGNDFQSGYRGIVIISGAAQYFEILANTFDGTSGTLKMGIGLQTSATGKISKLIGNTFTNIAESSGADTAVGGTTGFAVMVGSVLQAHSNVIHDNDNGVSIGVAPGASFDFSSDGLAAYGNQIYCNSKLPGGSANGYDLLLNYSAGSVANFAGNTWDNATPSTSTSLTTSTNGTDIVTGTSNGATLTSGVSIGSAACASGRVH
jgi:hypothetical protein